MTEEKWAEVAELLKTAYKGRNFLQTSTEYEVWYTFLQDLPDDAVKKATVAYISSSHFPPAISDIRGKCVEQSTQIKPWSEAWASVVDAIRYCGWNEEKAFESMDELAAKIVKRLGWKNLCTSENIAVDRANFRTIYEAEVQRARDTAQLPSGLRNELEQERARLADEQEERRRKAFGLPDKAKLLTERED